MQSVLESGARRSGSVRGGAARAAANSRAASDAAHTAIAVQAMQLLGRWQRVRNGHLALSAGCACGISASIDLREFDELILDYLYNKFSSDATLCDFLRHAAGVPAGPLAALLRRLATPPLTLPPPQAQAVLQALEASIASIEEQHP